MYLQIEVALPVADGAPLCALGADADAESSPPSPVPCGDIFGRLVMASAMTVEMALARRRQMATYTCRIGR